MTVSERQEFGRIAIEVIKECMRSRRIHGKFCSAHHGISVTREEFEELWDEVKRKKPDPDKMRTEAIQLAAAAFHMITDICNSLPPAPPQPAPKPYLHEAGYNG